MADREVPLQHEAFAPALHQWLDGEISESAARESVAARDIEFWQRIGRQTAVRAQVRAPEGSLDRIMRALPDTTPVEVANWWRRPMPISPATFALLTIGLLALGLVVGAAALRSR